MKNISLKFKALSDPNRLRIIKLLQIKPLCVCELSAILGLANSTVSQHLSLLKKEMFIIEEKDGKWVNYRINNQSSDSKVISLLTLLSVLSSDEQIVEQDKKAINEINRHNIQKIDRNSTK